MICEFENGYFKKIPIDNKLDPSDFNDREDYIEALENQIYEIAEKIIIEFPSDMTTIKNNFMNNCPIHFKGIKISKNIKVIEEGAFWYLDVDEISVDKDNEYFDSRDNCNCIIDSKTNKLLYGNIYSVIPDSVVDIDYYSFCNGAFNENDIKKYSRYDNAYYLGTKSSPYHILVRAIDDKIEKCIIHPNTKIIYTQSFQRCSLLKEITIPGNVDVIAEEAFSFCSQLDTVNISDGVKKISSRAFGYCKNLKNVTLPSTINEIVNSCFCGCSSLKEVAYKGNMKQWRNIVLNNSIFENVDIMVTKCRDGEITE